MKNLSLILLCLMAGKVLRAQEVVASSGDYLISSSGSISYTLGECVDETFSASNISLTQGFQQVQFSVTAISELPSLSFSVLVSPNPTTDRVDVTINKERLEGIRIQLFDLAGRKLLTLNVTSKVTEIPFINYSPSVYLLKVTENNKELKTIKIIKH